MLNCMLQMFNSWVRLALVSCLVLGLGWLGNAAPAVASSKAATPEALDLAINESAQEFVESVLDDYADILEDTFEAAYDPLKSVVKDASKQLSKAAKAAEKGGEETTTASIVLPQEPFQIAVADFAALQAVIASYKAQIDSSPAVVQALLEASLGENMAALEQAIADVATTVDLIAADVASLETAEPTTATAFEEHSLALTQSIEAVDLAIDSFDS